MKALIEMLSESEGGISSMRVAMFIILIAMIGQPVYYAIANNLPSPEIDWENLTLVLGALGLKAVQRGQEKPNPQPPTQ